MSEETQHPDIIINDAGGAATTPPAVNEPIKFENLYCSTCRSRKTDAELMKTPIDYRVNADGSSASIPERYSLFCGTCQKFLGIYDPKAQQELADMTKTRMEKENEESQKK